MILPPVAQANQFQRTKLCLKNVRWLLSFPSCNADNHGLVLRSGINILHSTTVDDSALGPRLPQLCQQSKALYAVCIAFQVSLSGKIRHRFYEYFHAAIATFRSELSHCKDFLNDGTWNAGLILCTIGVCFRILPFTKMAY